MSQWHFFFIKQKDTLGKKGVAIFLTLSHVCLQANLMSPRIPGRLWSALASTLMTKRFTGHDSITFGCLTHFRFPHLPVKRSFYIGVSFHTDKHKEKGVREREKGRQPVLTCWTPNVNQDTLHTSLHLIFSTCKVSTTIPQVQRGKD